MLEDPVGPSMFDPEGKGHHGHEGISAFWEQAIAPIDEFEFDDQRLVRQPGQQHLRQHRPDQDVFPDGSHTTTDLIMVYVVDDDGRVASMKAFWEPERTMASFTEAA